MRQNQKKVHQQIIALATMFLMLLMPFVQAAHHHPHSSASILKNQVAAHNAHLEISNTCSICDLIAHAQHTYAHQWQFVQYKAFIHSVSLLRNSVIVAPDRGYTFTFANKGPPAI